MGVLTKIASDIFATTDAAGNPRGPVLGDVRDWGIEIERFWKVSGVTKRDQVSLATTSNIDLSSMPATISGVANTSQIFLAAGQTDAKENGVYKSNGIGVAATRRPNYDTADELAGVLFAINGGDNAGKLFLCAMGDGKTIGTDVIPFVEIAVDPTAEQARDQLFKIIDLSMVSKIYDTKAAADADISNIAADAYVAVLVDEDQSDQLTLYKKESGALVFKVALPAVPRTGSVDARTFGVTLDGVTDDLAAWNTLIAAINAGAVKSVIVPPGTISLSGEPDPITASDVVIVCQGTLFQMAAGAGTAGTFFQIGDGDTVANNFSLLGLAQFACLNTATLDGTRNVIHFHNANFAYVENVRMTSVNGAYTLGDWTDETTSSFVRTHNTYCRMHGPAGGIGIDARRANNQHHRLFTFGSAGGRSAASQRGIRIKPADGEVIDAGTWDGQINLPDDGCKYAIELDITDGIITNHNFNSCVADHTVIAGVYIHCDSGALSTARMTNVFFNGHRSISDGGGSVLIDNTGDGIINNLQFNGGVLVAKSKPGIYVKAAPTASKINWQAIGVNVGLGTEEWRPNHLYVVGNAVWDDESTGNLYDCLVEHTSGATTLADDISAHPTYWQAVSKNPAAFGGVLDGATIVNCSGAPAVGVTCWADYGVKPDVQPTGALTIAGNNFSAVKVAAVDVSTFVSAYAGNRIIKDNLAPNEPPAARVGTVAASAKTIASFTLTDGMAYQGQFMVTGVQDDDASKVASYLLSVHARCVSGTVTVDKVTVLDSNDGITVSAAATVIGGVSNQLAVRVAGKASTTIWWACETVRLISVAA